MELLLGKPSLFSTPNVYARENAKTETKSLPMPRRAISVLTSLEDAILPEEIKERIKNSNVESIMFRDKTDS